MNRVTLLGDENLIKLSSYYTSNLLFEPLECWTGDHWWIAINYPKALKIIAEIQWCVKGYILIS
jgi:hypothetical protein